MRFPGRNVALCRFTQPTRRPLSTTSSLSFLETKPDYRKLSKSWKEAKREKKHRLQNPTNPWFQDDAKLEKLNARSRVDSVSQGHDPNTRMRLNGGHKLSNRHGLFRNTALQRFKTILAELEESPFTLSGIGKEELNRQAGLFMNTLDQAFFLANQNITHFNKNPLFWNLREAFITRDLKGLQQELQYSFQSYILQQRSSKGIERSQQSLVDFRFPYEFFPATRTMQRTIHLHVGPTNSGKTYRALKALEKSKNGLYCGPLRLLATEVYQRLNASGHVCGLWTGEEIRIPDNVNQYLSSCTTEMAPLNVKYDVAVVDEIQMIGDTDRGNAWTSALLGLQAKELHLCGEERAVNLVQKICASVGDKCVVHRYERLSPLQTMNQSIESDYSKLQKGDAIVAFSRLTLHALKRSVEQHTGRRCAIVYGALPPEVRVQQAALFNDPDNDYDYIVASDAIGMGLNLEVRRIILEGVTKFDGQSRRLLSTSEIKQIGGRAGRYRTARTQDSKEEEKEEKMGYVTTMDRDDLKIVGNAFKTSPPDIEKAHLAPPAGIIEQFAAYFPADTPLSYIMLRLKESATVSDLYDLHITSAFLDTCDLIQDIPLTIYDKITFAYAPSNKSLKNFKEVFRAYAKCVAYNKSGRLLDVPEVPLEVLDLNPESFSNPTEYLWQLEELHMSISLYTWLSYRYPSVFISQDMAFHVRTLVEERLMFVLEKLDFTDEQLSKKRTRAREAAKRMQAAKAQLGRDGPDVQHEEDTPPLDLSTQAEAVEAAEVAEATEARAT